MAGGNDRSSVPDKGMGKLNLNAVEFRPPPASAPDRSAYRGAEPLLPAGGESALFWLRLLIELLVGILSKPSGTAVLLPLVRVAALLVQGTLLFSLSGHEVLHICAPAVIFPL